jgi:hypothetical protein
LYSQFQTNTAQAAERLATLQTPEGSPLPPNVSAECRQPDQGDRGGSSETVTSAGEAIGRSSFICRLTLTNRPVACGIGVYGWDGSAGVGRRCLNEGDTKIFCGTCEPGHTCASPDSRYDGPPYLSPKGAGPSRFRRRPSFYTPSFA